VTNLHVFAIFQGLIAVFLLAILFVALLAAAIFLRTVLRRLLGLAEEEEESA
jgi:hypothetical protein